ncbi:DUF6020 family protein [Butyrivibrio sp. WCE2006]|uniref:DUF6020 family protein n=1 Tax=Butyrivibrio sp. WCE2006 TaxID=1410611 RepID=UPI0005D20350|nr:DUF6020 family protein [Butyrivibrio sp. WCE2006]
MCNLETKELKNALIAFMCTWGLQILCRITVRNPLTLIFFGVFYYIGKKVQANKKKGMIPAITFALLLSIVAVLLFGQASVAGFSSSLFKILGMGIMFVGLFLSYFRVFQLVFGIGEPFGFGKAKAACNGGPKNTAVNNKSNLLLGDTTVFLLAFVICMLCWLPYFLYEYPGIMTADSIVQYEQVIGRIPWSNHHPVVHTLVISLCYRLGLSITGDVNKAISFYTVFQMLFLAGCCSRVVVQIKKLLGNVWGILLPLAFFALVPFNAVFAVTIWKDVPFAGIMMLMGCTLCEMALKEKISIADAITFAIEGIMVSLFRSNGWYGFLISIPFVIYIFRKDAAKLIISAITVIAVVLIVKGPVMSAANIAGPDFAESLSLPVQQVARVLVEDRELSEKDKSLIDAVIDTTYIHELYAPDFADNIKELVRAGHPEVLEKNKLEYLGLWFRLGFRHPIDYLRAWFDLEGGYVYSDIPYEVGNIDGIMQNDYGLIPTPLIGGKAVVKGKEILIKLGSFIPLYGMLWCAGAYTWIVVLSLFILIINRKDAKSKRFLPLFILQLAIILTLLIAAPMVDFRYEYGIVMLMPLTVAICVIIKGRKTTDFD